MYNNTFVLLGSPAIITTSCMHDVVYDARHSHHTTFMALGGPGALNMIQQDFHRWRGLTVATIVLILCCCNQRCISFTPPHRGECRFFLDTADTDEVRG
jgi:alpha-D-ribose 1-methylphosphonate 5-triphosphate synthase subunit PhnH